MKQSPTKFMSALLLVALFMTGCSFLKEMLGFGFTRPKVELKNIELKGFSLSAVDLLVTLTVKNPNDFAIKLKSLDYKVRASQMNLAHGKYHQDFTVPEQGANDITLPLKVSAKNAILLGKQVYENSEKKVIAIVTALAKFDSPIGIIEHDFVEKKELKIE